MDRQSSETTDAAYLSGRVLDRRQTIRADLARLRHDQHELARLEAESRREAGQTMMA